MINKKLLLCISLAHLPILGMEEDVSQSPFETYLKEHKWHERKDALSQDQREEFADYLEGKKASFKTPISDNDLGSLLVTGLNEVERKKSPEELQEMLYKAIVSGSASKAKYAVQLGVSIARKKGDKTPLLSAVLLKKSKVVAVLVDLGAKIEKDYVQWALSLGDTKTASLLAIKGNFLDESYRAANRHNRLQEGNWTGIALTTHAMAQGDFESAVCLIRAGAPFTDSRDEVIKCIFDYMNDSNSEAALELLQILIDRGYNADNIWELGPNSIYREKVITLLLKNRANPNHIIISKGSAHGPQWTPLFQAISTDNEGALKTLISAGADTNQKSKPIRIMPTFTPLSFAIHLGRDKMIEILVQNGAML